MRYLSDIINELPKNCIFNKGKVGCGGTTLAIEGDQPYVIAVPFGSLTTNKVSQYPNERCGYTLLSVMDGVTSNDVRVYLDSVDIPKIITTYDSLPKVIDAFDGDVSQINLLVDEYHILFTQYSFRKDAIKQILKSFRCFKSFTFMTATALENEFILEELQDLPIKEQVWQDDEKLEVTVKALKCKDVMASASKLIRMAISGKVDGNLYFFVNSVRAIKELVARNQLSEDNCRVIYSKSNPTKVGICNSTVESEPRKINFLTSTVFEGCDVFDEEGRTVILSDPYYTHSLLDISTSVQQIAGRIRNSRYIGMILHLYKQSKYRELSVEDFDAYIEAEIQKGKELEAYFNKLPEKIRMSLTCEPNNYIQKTDENLLYFDPNLPKLDLFNYKVENIYTSTVTLGQEYRNMSISTDFGEDNTCSLEKYRLNEGAGIDKMSFKKVVQGIREAGTFLRKILLDEAEAYYPFIRDAVHKLGFERLESLNYVQKDIRNELLMISDTTNDYKVFCKLGYSVGSFYCNSSIKRDLRLAYDDLGYANRSPKATDIIKYYDVRPAKKRIAGRFVEGYTVLNPKFRIKP